jgi:cytoskeletal protein RodZ
VPVAAEIAIPVPFPKREEKPEVRASFGTFDAVGGEEKKSSSSRLIVVAAVVLVVAAVSVFAFLRSRKPSQTSTTQPTQEAANVNSQVPPNAVPVAATAPGSGVGQPAPAASGAVVPAAATRPTTETLSADASRKSERNARPAENPVAPDRIERVASAARLRQRQTYHPFPSPLVPAPEAVHLPF